MSGGSMWRSQVECPFYRYDEPHRISCEGLGAADTTVLMFRIRKDRDQQMRIFCCEHYKNCELYRALMESKYEE